MTKKKIVHIIPTFSTGGAEMLVSKYYRYIPSEEFEVYVASGVEDGELRKRFEDTSRLFVGSRSKDGGRFGAWKKLRKFLRELKPDIIHSHLISSDFFAWWYKRFSGNTVRWVVTLHNVEHHTSLPRRFLWRCILPRADKIIAVSKAVADYAISELKVPAQLITVVLNGVELEPLLTVPTFNQKHLLDIATIGRLEIQKGHTYLLDALSKLKNFSWSLHIFGDGAERVHLQNKAKALGIDKYITWGGVVENVPERLNEIGVIVQPSLWEGLSLVVMEAMAAGRVVVGSNAAAAELIDDAKTGYVVPSKDSAALAEKLRYIFEHPTEAVQVGEEARRYAEQHFSFNEHVKQIVGVYNSLLSG